MSEKVKLTKNYPEIPTVSGYNPSIVQKYLYRPTLFAVQVTFNKYKIALVFTFLAIKLIQCSKIFGI